jgi:hypothetical protein
MFRLDKYLNQIFDSMINFSSSVGSERILADRQSRDRCTALIDLAEGYDSPRDSDPEHALPWAEHPSRIFDSPFAYDHNRFS